MKEKWNYFKEKVLDLIYPKHVKCIFCGEELSEEEHNDTCWECLQILPYIKNACPKCGDQIGDNEIVCMRCKGHNYDFDQAKSVFAYVDEVAGVVHKLKFSNMKFLAEPMAKYMCELLATWQIEPDYITAVPLHKLREKERNYNQSKEIAMYIANNMNIPYVDLCEKVVNNRRQMELDFKERQSNVVDAYKVINDRKQDIKGKTILVIDDVITTGATTNEISKILKRAGAKAVFGLSFAHSTIKEEKKE